jgi:hypothetical protein
MQGTVVLLMALSGLGCHHKSCDGCYDAAPACYSGCYGGVGYDGCYSGYPSTQVGYISSAPGCYGAGYSACYTPAYSSCYGAVYDASYAAACYCDDYPSHGWFCGPRRRWGGGGCGLFSCFRRNRGCGCYATSYGCDAGVYDGCYSTPVFGSYAPTYAGNMIYGNSQIYGAGQVIGSTAYPSAAQTATAPVMTPTPTPAPDTATPPPPTPVTTEPPAPEPAPPPGDATPDAPAPGEVPKAPAPGTGTTAPGL